MLENTFTRSYLKDKEYLMERDKPGGFKASFSNFVIINCIPVYVNIMHSYFAVKNKILFVI